ncbi:PREDICTED: uncharacterized protein LOC104594012 [Nelumbo nucifera]|uniref:Uncharacterized protein LOC104594012 n=1 Tax=Nelumbo nucifera TaxID=4432 RepID=A0A1U7ZL46_NELNU|nr:PREDICTED: uncharacterized protein LOC104594012 [Nelumbo nucifera]
MHTHIGSNGMSDSGSMVATMWLGLITRVGQVFENAIAFWTAMSKYSIAHRFSYIYKWNDKTRIHAQCNMGNCRWEIRTSALGGGLMVRVHTYQPQRSHTVVASSFVVLPRSNKFVGNLLVEKIRDSLSYRAIGIMKDFKRDYTLQLTYQLAWKEKEVAKVPINDNDDDSYSRIPWFYEKILESNPGLYVTYSIDEDGHFMRLFLAFHASIHGFHYGCRPLLFVDGAHLNGKYQGKLLATTTIDANNGMFPITFFIVPAECLEDSTWFMGHLKAVINDDRDVVIVLDRGNSLLDAVQWIFQPDLHAFCCRHLMENLKSFVTRIRLSKELRDAIMSIMFKLFYARSTDKYEALMGRLFILNERIESRVRSTEPEHWANSKLPGMRYDQMLSNIAKMFNGWVSNICDRPIMTMLNTFQLKLMELLWRRHCESQDCTTMIGKRTKEKLHVTIHNSIQFQVVYASIHEFEVTKGERQYTAQLDQ